MAGKEGEKPAHPASIAPPGKASPVVDARCLCRAARPTALATCATDSIDCAAFSRMFSAVVS
jgi:hypothetical protein